MKALIKWYDRSLVNRLYVWAIVIVAAILAIVLIFNSPKTVNADPGSVYFSSQMQYDAFGYCCGIATEKYGTGKHNFLEAEEIGEHQWLIRGTTETNEKQIWWTGNVKYNAPDESWNLIAWMEHY